MQTSYRPNFSEGNSFPVTDADSSLSLSSSALQRQARVNLGRNPIITDTESCLFLRYLPIRIQIAAASRINSIVIVAPMVCVLLGFPKGALLPVPMSQTSGPAVLKDRQTDEATGKDQEKKRERESERGIERERERKA